MAQQTTRRWPLTLATAHTLAVRVELWDTANLLGMVAPLDGAVTDQLVTGVRRSLSLTLDPSAAPMVYPGVEVRVWSGLDYGRGNQEMLPLGCFPVTSTDIGIRPDDTIQISAQDRWQWVVACKFEAPKAADINATIHSQIAGLIVGTAQWPLPDVDDRSTNPAKPAAQAWDSDRHQAIADLCKLIGGTAYVGRDGFPIIEDRPGIAKPARYLTAPAGNILDAAEAISTADVHNVVVVTSTNTDTPLDPVKVEITEPTHPAFPRPGVPRSPVTLSGAYTTAAQMKTAGEKELTRVSARARSLKLTVIPDAALDAGDTVLVTLPGKAPEHAQIQSVTHPLRASGVQEIVTVSTRVEDL